MNAHNRDCTTTQPDAGLGPEFRTAWPESELVSNSTGEIVGFVYVWCNGERSPFWLDQPEENVVAVALP